MKGTDRQAVDDNRAARAVEALERGDGKEARRLCLDLVRETPDDPRCWRLLAAAAVADGDLDVARDALERSVVLQPLQPEALLELGRVHAARGRTEEASERLREAAAAGPGPRLLARIGEALGNLGRVEEAEDCFRRALDAEPSLAGARYNLALARLAAGSPEDARSLLEEVVAARPDLAPAWLQLGGALNAVGRYQDAVAALRRHLALAPRSAPGLTWLGASLQFLGDFDGAETSYRAALMVDGDCADARANLGKLLLAQGDPRQAEDHFRQALRASPEHVQALSGLAAALDDEGRYQEALEMTSRGWEQAPAVLGPVRARILRHMGRHQEAAEVLERAEREPGLPADARAQLAFSRAALADERGDHEAAWRQAEAGNRLKRSLMPPEAGPAVVSAMEHAVADLRRVFAADAMADLPGSGCQSERPVFVVGMPRSGKSLVEQVICSHPLAAGAGELTTLGAASSELAERLGGWPANASRAAAPTLDALASRYLQVLERAAGPEAARVTDTMPFNFVHLGLIEMLFPRARVIHCMRHPLDLALRCYFKNFAGRSLGFAFSLEDIARYFLAYRALMNHWQEVTGLAMYPLRYESLVQAPEPEIRRLLAFLDLDWDEDCLRFYEPGVATSAGPTPVRRPMDPREVGAWRNYGSQLADVAPLLPVAEYEDGGF